MFDDDIEPDHLSELQFSWRSNISYHPSGTRYLNDPKEGLSSVLSTYEHKLADNVTYSACKDIEVLFCFFDNQAYKFFTKELISSRSAFRSSIKASAYDQRLKCCSWSLCFNPSGFPQKAKYALEILKKHKYDNCHSIGTPLATKPKLDVDLSGEPVDQNDYRSKIGSLMYLTSSRPDLVQAVCYCARYQARTTQKHLKEVKRIFKYLKSVTLTCGLWYPKDYGCENYTAFSDADNAGALILEKHFLEGTTVPW
ncbi:hypothetical protein Tco_1226677 [Tanacetum coccineum]|uniref:Reverse transcriptase Ty1/copia-type domain-containing protein n=1 Tax=Tanacetum coccineum TaxID=301880 RepID=A0ABQ5AWP1_9ASTR